MEEKKINLIIGSLLHDIGKIEYRCNKIKENHSYLAGEFLKNEKKDLKDCAMYHHKKYIKYAINSKKIDDNSNCYITYIADNIAAGCDRREDDEIEGEEGYYQKFDKKIALDGIFNRLNIDKKDISKNKHDNTYLINNTKGINIAQKIEVELSSFDYVKIFDDFKDKINNIDKKFENINSILEIMEGYLSYIPSSTNVNEITDISLFDHSKITAAIASNIYDYLKENNVNNYKTELFSKEQEFYNKKVFLMISFDISGIQDFIYTTGNNKVLKSLRARSFYLELLLENMVDELLEKLELSRVNLIYTGGGHAYILGANTEKTKKIIEELENEIKNWFLDKFKTKLYLGIAYQEVSSNDLINKSGGDYKSIFENLAKKLSDKKLSRYNFLDILKLNEKNINNKKECEICRRVDKSFSNGKNICDFCTEFQEISSDLIEKEGIIVIYNIKKDNRTLEVFKNKYLKCVKKQNIKDVLKNEKDIISRIYYKNNMYTAEKLATKIWMGDYIGKDIEFEKMANSSIGVDKIAVLRADVDFLGQSFTSGFDEKIRTLSRTATLSRQLSLFFKYYLNYILKNPKYSITLEKPKERNCVIVYSGGDDLFIVGPWNEIIEVAVDIKNEFSKFCDDKLTISAGIGIYSHNYPLYSIAKEVENLESASKNVEGKDSITLFDNKHTYKWDVFINEVIDLNVKKLLFFLQELDEVGTSMIYQIVEYLRGIYIKSNEKDKSIKKNIDLVKIIYLISKFEPTKKQKEDIYEKFKEFILDNIESREKIQKLITSMYICVYLNREKEGSEQ